MQMGSIVISCLLYRYIDRCLNTSVQAKTTNAAVWEASYQASKNSVTYTVNSQEGHSKSVLLSL